ncbi:MAG: glycosyltransferase family 2 protein [Candidatus Hodarchaeota archaeon]
MEIQGDRLKITGNNYEELYKYVKKFESEEEKTVISIIIPVYNEEKTIKKILERLPNDNCVEIIVIDDYSTDNSIEEIKKAKNFRSIKLLAHNVNKGYGRALLTGIEAANGRIIITMDSDGQHRPEDLLNIITPILDNEADITIGSRYKGSYSYKLPLTTRFGEAFLEVIIELLFGQSIKNNQGGYRAFHRRAYKIFENLKFHGYAFTTELILSASLGGYKIKECPIHLLEREYGKSYINLNKLLYSLLLCIGLYFFKNIKRILIRK